MASMCECRALDDLDSSEIMSQVADSLQSIADPLNKIQTITSTQENSALVRQLALSQI